MNTTSHFEIEGTPLLSLHKFCKKVGISDITAWRWRKNGWLKTVNIAGRPYLTDKALADFMCAEPKRVNLPKFTRCLNIRELFAADI